MSKPKPTVRITDWYISGDRLFGTAIDHPDARPNSDVMSSTIMKHEGDIVETLNTIYKLEKPHAKPETAA